QTPLRQAQLEEKLAWFCCLLHPVWPGLRPAWPGQRPAWPGLRQAQGLGSESNTLLQFILPHTLKGY
ncbi:hypothetical protein A2U01_0068097, partial [Trifolium medium]|nr:hypothetical protein [Trifolium medium]